MMKNPSRRGSAPGRVQPAHLRPRRLKLGHEKQGGRGTPNAISRLQMPKRNQVEEAIAAVLERGSMQLNSQIRNRVKRLLDTDRALGRNKRARDPEKARYAFYSREMPGRGFENLFSEFEAFALLMALRLMGLGLPQGVVVTLLRRLRPQQVLSRISRWRSPVEPQTCCRQFPNRRNADFPEITGQIPCFAE